MTATVSPSLRHHLDVGKDGSATLAQLPGSFSLHYQPQLDLQSGAILQCEALLRWHHPDFGPLRPHVTLEGTRWADELGGLEGWAANEVCRQGARWGEDGLWVQIALNVSTAFLLRPGFVNLLLTALERSGSSPHLLAIDIPVGALAADPHQVITVSRALADHGIGVNLDGVVGGMRTTGLDSVDADAWKIELSSSTHSSIPLHPTVATAVDQAHRAGAIAIAKAVEDEGRLVEIGTLGFDAAFGNIVSAPMAASSVRNRFRPPQPAREPLFGPRR